MHLPAKALIEPVSFVGPIFLHLACPARVASGFSQIATATRRSALIAGLVISDDAVA